MRIKVLSVSEVNNYIKKVIDNDFILRNLSVKGEISNLKYHSSGHIYFSLKDEKGKINCVMFRSDSLGLYIELKDGMEVIVRARASIYEANGSLQLYCTEITQTGLGDLYIKFEKLKEKLLREGLFDDKKKKTLPKNIKRIGVVTALTGAAIHDILNVTKRRNSSVDIVLYPAKVQGEGAYKTVIKGIEYFNKNKSVDVIIIGRGGGSIEELWNFNEEELAYSIFKSKIPIISAVGHEVDYTISDFVADIRAATPSQGAELAAINQIELKNEIIGLKTLLNKNIDSIIKLEKNKLNSMDKILRLNSPIIKINNNYMELDSISDKLNTIIKTKLSGEKGNLKEIASLLVANNPLNILNKGYTIIKNNENKILKSKNDIKNNEIVEIVFKDGTLKGKFSIE